METVKSDKQAVLFNIFRMFITMVSQMDTGGWTQYLGMQFNRCSQLKTLFLIVHVIRFKTRQE